MKKLLILFCLILINICVPVNNASAENVRWQNPRMIYTYVPSGYRHSALMKEAFAYWSRITKNKIIFKYVNNKDKAQIKVRFVKDTSSISQLENALGITHYKAQKICKSDSCKTYLIQADIDIANNTPGGGLLVKDRVYGIMIHEIGHAIGLVEHSQDKKSLMYPYKISRNQTITQDDLAELAKLYGWK